MKRVFSPISNASELKAGDEVLLCGEILTARGAAHKRICELEAENMPVSLEGQTIFYVGPSMKDGKITSAGPTTSMRMDKYTPTVLERGAVALIGKGDRKAEVYDALKKFKGVYFVAVGGAGAIYADCIKKHEIVAYEDLGSEAIFRLEVEDMPLVVAIDGEGSSIFR